MAIKLFKIFEYSIIKKLQMLDVDFYKVIIFWQDLSLIFVPNHYTL